MEEVQSGIIIPSTLPRSTESQHEIIEFGEDCSSGRPVRFQTDSDEQKYLAMEMENTVSKMGVLTPGITMLGKSIASISKSMREPLSLAVEIKNFLDSDIGELEHNFEARSIFALPQVIKSRTSEALAFSSPNSYLNGAFSYPMPNVQLRLVVTFNQKELLLAVALAPLDLPPPTDSKQLHGLSTNIKWFKKMERNDIMHGVARTSSVCAGVRLISLEAKSILQLSIVDLKTKHSSKIHKVGSSEAGMANANYKLAIDKSEYWTLERIFEHVLRHYGYVLEITNLLDDSLNEPISFIESGQKSYLGPEVVPANSREVMIAEVNYSGHGNGCVVTYRIGKTDIRLAVACQLFNNGNKFAIAFISLSTPTDGKLLKILFNDNLWRTSSDIKFSQAKDGDIVIQTRNIRAKANMTDSMKAVINVVIKSF